MRASAIGINDLDLEPAIGNSDQLCDLSIIIPVMNEEDNIAPLYTELHEVLEEAGLDYEILFIDDGSKDRTLERLRTCCGDDPRVTIIALRRNFGQTAALAAGFRHSRGRVLIPMDADLQNDPHDIPALLARLDAPTRCDIVSGWRKARQDKLWTRRIPSQAANRLIRYATGVSLHDFGCTMKAYRRETLEGVSLYSELHRFLPALAAWNGAKITEMVVNHRPRLHGQTKYGLRRTLKVVLDLVTVKFFGTYMTKPLYFFGKIGLVTMALVVLVMMVAVGQKFGYFGQPQGLNLNNNILVSLAGLLTFFSIQCLAFGLLAELLVRIYHENRGQPPYRIRAIYRCQKNADTTVKSL
ncbi:MAG TPA: glycosyltransferase family 2 protein [Phycisphaerae bacterium]|mgnify:CR=1 FL=1|jgi:glycosyltransferase involved in cell wall biosynthesis|nr:glycosyltransferase family 2 protein [Phycisphaerae bacterium]HOB74139.1 glycosyltransferase family 2 protein [Phycisphaerae bacterium]HOJ56408.1 glycosyltransferase family 2 protein [Phycisphaerae bacterium]HOL28238.1 glycosyltransferase family 2 protein [Phycisphaerae bacterium]HPP22493.1 glycosyltransferase family 2 protein [Phycisphaerae bacterium]